MRTLASLVLAGVLALTSCGGPDESSSTSTTPLSSSVSIADGQTFTILVAQGIEPQTFAFTCDGLAKAGAALARSVLDYIGDKAPAEVADPSFGYNAFADEVMDPAKEQLLAVQNSTGCTDQQLSELFQEQGIVLDPNSPIGQQFSTDKPPGPIIVPPPDLGASTFDSEILWSG